MALDFDTVKELQQIARDINKRLETIKTIKRKMESDRGNIDESLKMINDEINECNVKLNSYTKINPAIKQSFCMDQDGNYFLRHVKKCPRCDYVYTHKKQLIVHNYESHSY